MSHQNEEVAGGAKAVDKVGSPPTPVVYPVVKLDVGAPGQSKPVAADADGKLLISGVAGAVTTEYDDGDLRGTATGQLAMVDDGVNVQALHGDVNGDAQVDVLTEPATVADGGVLPAVVKVVAGYDGATVQVLATDANGNAQVDVLTHPGVVGTVADDATTPGAPVMVGGKAVAMDGTDPTAVAEADVAIARTTLDRRVLVTLEHPYSPDPVFHEETGAVTDHELIAAPAAGFRIHIDWITISNDGTAALTVKFEEATAGAKTQRLGTIRMAAACPGVHLPYVSNPPKCTAATNFGMTTTGNTNYSVTVGYHLAP